MIITSGTKYLEKEIDGLNSHIEHMLYDSGFAMDDAEVKGAMYKLSHLKQLYSHKFGGKCYKTMNTWQQEFDEDMVMMPDQNGMITFHKTKASIKQKQELGMALLTGHKTEMVQNAYYSFPEDNGNFSLEAIKEKEKPEGKKMVFVAILENPRSSFGVRCREKLDKLGFKP